MINALMTDSIDWISGLPLDVVLAFLGGNTLEVPPEEMVETLLSKLGK
jgi:hypothetical protein